jgi:long-chain acyl-CoA synthetase
MLAQRLNIPVVPMRIDGLFALKQSHRILTRPGAVQVTIGAPVSFSADMKPADITRELERRVAAL